MAAFVALISAAVSPAAAQSAPPPFHPKPHPGVPLVVPDPPAAPSAEQNKPAGENGSPKSSPAAVPTKSTSRPPSKPHTMASTAHAAKAARSHTVIAQAAAPSGGAAKAPGAYAEQLPTHLPGTAVAQTGSFAVSQLGHSVGTANFRFASTAAGYDATSTVQVSMQGLDYALSKNELLDPARHILHVVLSATVNGQAVSVSGRPDAGQFLLNISANGRSSTTRLASHSAAVLLADFDPGGFETLLMLATAQNGRDLWAILPKHAGSVEAVQLATYADEAGTLDGKPITVHHLVATIAEAATDLFCGPDNRLLQAELPQQGFSLIRKGFVLTPPKRPVVPAE